MSSANIRRVKTIKYSHMLDHLVSIAEYSIFTDGYSKFANIVLLFISAGFISTNIVLVRLIKET